LQSLQFLELEFAFSRQVAFLNNKKGLDSMGMVRAAFDMRRFVQVAKLALLRHDLIA